MEINFEYALTLYNKLLEWENKVCDYNTEDNYLRDRQIQIRIGLKYLREELYYVASYLEDKEKEIKKEM